MAINRASRTILAYGIFAILAFLPMIQFYKIVIPTILFLLPVLIFKNRVVIDKKAIRFTLLTTTILCFTYLPALLQNDVATPKDVLFVAYPLYMLSVWHIISNLFQGIDNKTISSCIKVFLMIQLIFCLMQLTNFLDTNSIFKPLYLHWQSVNTLKYTDYLEVSYRPFGTVGNPTVLSVIVYLLARTIRKVDKKTGAFYLLAILIVVLSGSRTALAAIILIELYERVLKNIFKKPAVSITSLILIALAIPISIANVPFIRTIFDTYILSNNSIRNDYSIHYRLSMINLLKHNTRYLLFGGYGIYNFPSYVDSEIILRLLQFGIVNFGLIISFYGYKFINIIKKIKKTDRSTLIATTAFLIICSLTATVFTNLMTMQFILIYLVVAEQNRQEVRCA